MSQTRPMVLPTKIPWKDLKGKELEECVYWLLHSMGAKDLQWRVGGKGQGAADGGRDLEATFYSSDPDGEMSQKRWWLEAKGRSGTVEKEAILSSVQNASGFPEADILVIATNTQFSNPTIDWVRSWNAQKPKPKIRLWDRNTLERHLCSHPEVIGRFFAKALSPQGHLELLRTQFWNYAELGQGITLKSLWRQRGQLKWDTQAQIAVIASEVTNGSVIERAWGAALSDDDLREVFATALVNGPSTLLRAHQFGRELESYVDTLSYLLLNMLVRFKGENVAKFIENLWDLFEGPKIPQEIRDMFVEPMLARLETEVFDICLSDCHRLHTDRRLLTEKQVENYWDRLRVREAGSPASEEEPILSIELAKQSCKVGFDVNEQKGCPYNGEQKEDIERKLKKLQTTILYRFGAYCKREDDPMRKFLR